MFFFYLFIIRYSFLSVYHKILFSLSVYHKILFFLSVSRKLGEVRNGECQTYECYVVTSIVY